MCSFFIVPLVLAIFLIFHLLNPATTRRKGYYIDNLTTKKDTG